MSEHDDRHERPRRAAMRHAEDILAARRRAEDDLLRVKEALEARTHELDALSRAGMAMASTPDIATLRQVVTDEATQASGAAFGAFVRAGDGAGKAYRVDAVCGAPRERLEALVDEPSAARLVGPA